MSNLRASIPVWVSRENAQGVISQAFLPLWVFFTLFVLALANACLWLPIGVYEAVKVIVGILG